MAYRKPFFHIRKPSMRARLAARVSVMRGYMEATFAAAMAAVVIATALPAAAHKAVDPVDAASQFKVGVSTVTDVEGLLGRPQSVAANSSGAMTIVYSSTKTHIKAATFIPYVGLFAGGATADTSAISFVFGPDGKLLSYQSTSSRADCSVNILGPGCRGGYPAAQPPTAGASNTAQ